ncbi:MAG: DNA topoisomerase [Lachnospiraceae bacterium]|jgi:DNA topoisomerase-3|nr:DNA topoisomerase [Lachnospiraceae bacterium]MCI1726817.1 DNA topoisomerase [Lachnospiraceae bacterium]
MSTGKFLFIAEKPSVAQEFAKVLKVGGTRHDGYVESEDKIVTWCVGHLVTMSYPEKYDIKYKRWSLNTLPFLPSEFKYEIIPDVRKQFEIVSGLLERKDVERIYVCTDSGREGEYIYRLVEMMSDRAVAKKDRRRVWIDSQTEEEIQRGVREAKDLSAYDHLSDAAYLRAKEDYLMGINFSRLLTLKYGSGITNYLGTKWSSVSVGRVMTCVLGMVVRREREIRAFVKTPFYRVIGSFELAGEGLEAEWRAVSGSAYENSPELYKENGFKKRESAEKLVSLLKAVSPQEGIVTSAEKKKEKKMAPLLYNLAELQNDCSRMYHISPDQTLEIAQELYEKKLTTYPRTDARVLSSGVAKVIRQNIQGLSHYTPAEPFVTEVLSGNAWKSIGSTRYTNDKAITDHYAIIPTGSGFQALNSLNPTAQKVYGTIVKRFLSIFYPPAEFQKTALTVQVGSESFFAGFRTMTAEGYLKVLGYSASPEKPKEGEEEENEPKDAAFSEAVRLLKKGDRLPVKGYTIKEGETTPPKRYTSGSMILAMENAGQLIEDEDLREQIKGSGIGTSATRAEILKKLVKIRYLNLNRKTQVITPELLGEMVFDAVSASVKSLLNPELTASWEKGLNYVAEGTITPDDYMTKLESFIRDRVEKVRNIRNEQQLQIQYRRDSDYYPQRKASGK